MAIGLRAAAEAFDEICRGHAKPFGKFDNAAGADPVGPFFVLLHLLKRDPRRRAELGLAHNPFLSAGLRNGSPTRWSSSFFVFIATSVASVSKAILSAKAA